MASKTIIAPFSSRPIQGGWFSLEWAAFFKDLERDQVATLSPMDSGTTYTNDELRDYVLEIRAALVNNREVQE